MNKFLNLIFILNLIFFINFFILISNSMNEILIEWILFEYNSFSWELNLKFDWKSICFNLIVLLISMHIFIYSYSYLNSEKEKNLFFWVLLIFIFSMLIFIYSYNLPLILIGWDGLGISSFMLICFYHSTNSMNSSIITIMLNRVGDLMIIFSISFFMLNLTWNIEYLNFSFYSIFMIVASFSKSAQIPFMSWLPKAMAAPTPVSSLVHSSTLVTAGVYLLMRMHLFYWMNWKMMIFYISFFTLLISGMMSLMSYDLKEIIAFSTLNHISLMIMSLSLFCVNGAFFHLCTHALFKALIFMCSGYILFKFGIQDIRKLNFFSINPLINFSFFFSIISMIGLPFLSGYMSKDLIFDILMMNKKNFNFFFLFTFVFTSLYSIRLLTLLKKKFNPKFFLKKFNDSMVKSVLSLSLFTLVSGFIFQWLIFPLEFILPSNFSKILILSIIFFCILFNKIFILKKNFFFFYFSFLKIYSIFNYMIMKKNFFIYLEKKWLYLFLMFLFNKSNNIYLMNKMKKIIFIFIIFIFMI